MLANSIITTSNSAHNDTVAVANELAKTLGLKYIPRERLSFNELKEKTGMENMLIVTDKRIYLKTGQGDFFFHPNMARVRIKSMDAGKTDLLVTATGVQSSDMILDCTLGFAADAIVFSYLVGTGGHVVGIESEPLIAELTRRGLQHYDWGDSLINAALKRIKVITADHTDYLRQLPDRSFDIVYFDPMFRQPVYRSNAIQPLRIIANASPLTELVINEAKRVARRRVVLKERHASTEFARLGFKHILGGKSSYLAFGYIEIN